jgi:hypothetical protein
MRTAQVIWEENKADVRKGWNNLNKSIHNAMIAFAKEACDEQRRMCAERLNISSKNKDLTKAIQTIITTCPEPKFKKR